MSESQRIREFFFYFLSWLIDGCTFFQALARALLERLNGFDFHR